MLFSSFQIYHACVSAYILLLQVITLTAPRVIIDEKELVRENSQSPATRALLLIALVVGGSSVGPFQKF
jgi:multisubunit Na+/H+ antiporter MnhC subunit